MTQFLAVVALLAAGASGQVPSLPFHGSWAAGSGAHLAVNGDMEVGVDEVTWAVHGEVKYKTIQTWPDAVVLELEREVACGKFVRLGPFGPPLGGPVGLALEVAFYRTREEAVEPRGPRPWLRGKTKDMYSLGCMWGTYGQVAN